MNSYFVEKRFYANQVIFLSDFLYAFSCDFLFVNNYKEKMNEWIEKK